MLGHCMTLFLSQKKGKGQKENKAQTLNSFVVFLRARLERSIVYSARFVFPCCEKNQEMSEKGREKDGKARTWPTFRKQGGKS